jgi:hypothetical protein
MSQISLESAVALRRVRERHCVGGQIATGVLPVISAMPGQPLAMVLGWLDLTAVAAFFWGAPFWKLSNLSLNASAAAVSIGLIDMCAHLAGYLGNLTTGPLRSHGFGDRAGLFFFATCYILGGVVVSFVKNRGEAMVPLAPPNQQMS